MKKTWTGVLMTATIGLLLFGSRAKAEQDTTLSGTSSGVSQNGAPYTITWKGTVYLNSQDTLTSFTGTYWIGNGLPHQIAMTINPGIAPGVQSSWTGTAGGLPANSTVNYSFKLRYVHNGQNMIVDYAGQAPTGP